MATTTKIRGQLTPHNYRCQVCDATYGWGQHLLCNNCETLFVPYVNQYLYDKEYARKYADYQKSEINRELQDCRWQTVLTYKDKGRLLDYGCGAGAFLEARPETATDKDWMRNEAKTGLAYYNWDVWGTDINECYKPYWKNHRTLELAESLEEKWDVITMFDVLEHLPELNLLYDIREALNKDGILVIGTPNFHMDLMENIEKWRHYRPKGEHVFCFSKKSIEKLCKKYGFKLIGMNYSESKVRKPEDNIATYVLTTDL